MREERFLRYAQSYADTVYRIAFHSCKNAADSEDIVQNLLLKLFRTEADFESEEHVRRWMIRVAVNESKKLVCSAWFRKSVPLEEYADALCADAPEESALFLAVMALPKKYRVPLYLYYYEDYPVREVAAAVLALAFALALGASAASGGGLFGPLQSIAMFFADGEQVVLDCTRDADGKLPARGNR